MRLSAGFTYIELIVILVIVGLISVAVLPRVPGQGIETGPEVTQLASDLRYAQLRSMNEGQRLCLTFASTGYALSTAASGCTAGVPSAAGLPSPLILRDASLTVQGLPNNLIAFDGMGAPYSSVGAAAAPLTAPAVLTVTVAGVSGTITVTPTTGLIVSNP